MLKKSFTYEEMQELIKKLNELEINGEHIFEASEGNWKWDGTYLRIHNWRDTGHFFLPLAPESEEQQA